MSSIPEIANHCEYNIQYTSSVDSYDETQPLLRPRRSNANWLLITFLFLTFCCGLIVGIYLLIKEKEWDDDEHYHPEILETNPRPKVNFTTLPTFELPLSKVLLIEIHGPPCNTSESCVQRIRKLYSEGRPNQDQCVSYSNFLVTDEGSVYEYLGWDVHYTVCDNDMLIVILLGKIETASPSSKQLNQVRSLLNYGVRMGKLANCYSVLTRKNFSDADIDLLNFANSVKMENNLKNGCRRVVLRED